MISKFSQNSYKVIIFLICAKNPKIVYSTQLFDPYKGFTFTHCCGFTFLFDFNKNEPISFYSFFSDYC